MVYTFDEKKIKSKLVKLRKENKDTQETFAKKLSAKMGGIEISRTTVATWETDKNQTVPKYDYLINICNMYDCDVNYFFEDDSVKSKEIKEVADLLHISEKSVEILKDNSNYGNMLDCLINNDSFDSFVNRINQLTAYSVVDDAITTVFTESYCKKLKQFFDEYYFSEFPMEVSKENFRKFLLTKISSNKFNPEKYIERKFLEEGKNCVYNQCDDFSALSKLEKYDLIINFISDVGYDHFDAKKKVENSEFRLQGIMSLFIKDVIEKLTKFLKPLISFIFPEIKNNKKISKEISMNIIANILGLGNASTPLGLKAMESMQKENNDKSRLSDSMAMFILINTASLQIIPTTVISIRSSLGSQEPAKIIIAVWIATIAAFTTAIISGKILVKKM